MINVTTMTDEEKGDLLHRVRQFAMADPDLRRLTDVSDERILDVAARPETIGTFWNIAWAAINPDPRDPSHDHPADLIREHAEQITHRVPGTSAERLATFRAATALRTHEERYDVTFIAAKNTDLARLRSLLDTADKHYPDATFVRDMLDTMRAIAGPHD